MGNGPIISPDHVRAAVVKLNCDAEVGPRDAGAGVSFQRPSMPNYGH
jgi:hypothetical protein